jgi:hypothetical protein
MPKVTVVVDKCMFDHLLKKNCPQFRIKSTISPKIKKADKSNQNNLDLALIEPQGCNPDEQGTRRKCGGIKSLKQNLDSKSSPDAKRVSESD